MARVVFCIVPLLFAFGSCATVVETVVSDVVDTVTDYLSLTNATFAALDFVGLAAEDGYSAAAYNVTTDDGYILTIFRLTGNGCSANSSRPVLLQHGFGLSADTWLDAGVNASLAYLLADDCYDLWVGNARGNYYGRAHTTLDPDTDAAFWEYSLEEFGYYDLPAMIDYVLDNTGYSQLDYIGYSQGGGSILITASERAEYNDKINLFIGLAPATRLLNTTSNFVNLIASTTPFLNLLPRRGSLREVLYRGSLTETILKEICALADTLGVVYDTCDFIFGFLDAYHVGSVADTTMSRLYYHFPAGVSVKLIDHSTQLKTAVAFDKYDYGSTENLELYGTATVPSYNLTAVTMPAVIIRALNDKVVAPTDADWLQSQLPNLVNYITVEDSLWTHFDFPYSQYIPVYVYPLVEEYLKSYNA